MTFARFAQEHVYVCKVPVSGMVGPAVPLGFSEGRGVGPITELDWPFLCVRRDDNTCWYLLRGTTEAFAAFKCSCRHTPTDTHSNTYQISQYQEHAVTDQDIAYPAIIRLPSIWTSRHPMS